MLDIREILDAHNSDIRIIAKIENQEGVDNIDEILEVADGVMVARGDLGIEVPQERIPGIQRTLIRKCILAKKPVIVATQMLHTMINNPRPTRAEVTDIANAIYYRTDALMLSGETAYGKYPVEAVKTMTKIAAQAEKDKLEENDIRIPLDENSNDVTAFLAKQAVKATTKLKYALSLLIAIKGALHVIWLLSVVNIRCLPFVIRRKRCVTWHSLMEWRRSTCLSWPTDRSIILPLCVVY